MSADNEIAYNLTLDTSQAHQAARQTIDDFTVMGTASVSANQRAGASIDALASKLQAFGAGHERITGDVIEGWKRSGEVISDTGYRTDASSRGLNNASIAARGLAQEMGVSLPRATTRWLSQLDGVGPLLTGAFGTVAVIGMVEALSQVPKEFDKLVGAVTGWDEKSKQAYERFRADNLSALESLTKFHAKMLEVGAPTAEAGRAASLQYQLQEAETELSPLVHRQAILHQKANDIRNGPMYVRGADGTDTLAPTSFEGMSPRELDAAADSMSEDLEKRRKAVQDLKDQYAALNKEIANKGGRAFGEDLQNFNESFMKSDARSNALASAVNQAVAAHRPALDILEQFGKAMEAEEQQAVKTGTAVKGAFVPFLAMMHEMDEYKAVAKDTDVALAKMNTDTAEQTSALISAEASWQRWLATMKAIPLGTAEAQRQFDTMNTLIERNEQVLQSSTRPGFLGGTILQHGIVPNPGAMATLNAPAPIGSGSRAPDPEDFKRWDAVGQSAIDDVTRSMGRMFTDSIARGQNFWTAFKNLGKDAVSSITEFFFEHLMQGLLDPWKQSLGRLISGAGESITGGISHAILGGGGFRASSGPWSENIPGIGSSANGLSRIASGGLFGTIFGGGSAAAATPSISMIGSVPAITGVGGALDTTIAPPAMGGLASSLGLGSGATGLFGMGAATLPVLGIFSGIGYGLWDFFHKHRNVAPQTPDALANNGNPDLYFNSTPFAQLTQMVTKIGKQISTSMDKVSTAVGGLTTAEPGVVTKAGFAAIKPDVINHVSDSLGNDRGFRRTVAGAVLSQPL